MGVIDEGQRFSISVQVSLGAPGTDTVVLRQAIAGEDLVGEIYFLDLQMADPDGAGAMTSIEVYWEKSAVENRVTTRTADWQGSGMREKAPAAEWNLMARFDAAGAADGRIICSGAYK